ncbi:hypothetical protein FBU30_000845 [Linnemannia zychae]|nr:hypothetical protein FBU30_000845 [Linnemannia zychae]
MTSSPIEDAARECFANNTNKVNVLELVKALRKRNIDTHRKLVKIVESTDYLKLVNNNSEVQLIKEKFGITPYSTLGQSNLLVRHVSTTMSNNFPTHQPASATSSPISSLVAPQNSHTANSISPSVEDSTDYDEPNITSITRMNITCDTDAIEDILGDVALGGLDLDDQNVTDIFVDVGSYASAKINGECIEYGQMIEQSDVTEILERLPGEMPSPGQSNRVIFGKTLHRLATVTYDDNITGVTIRVGRSVSGLTPLFRGFVEDKNILLCGAPNVGKTTALREICKYLSSGKCLCLIDTSGEVCGDTGSKRHVVGTSRVFRPVDPAKQYATLLDCVRNHSPDVIAIDELNTKQEVEVCQTIALRSIQMVASAHGNIEDLMYNPMLNKALGGTTEATVSDRNAINGRKVVVQRTTRPIFDVVINVKRTSEGLLEYSFIEDVAKNVSLMMEGKPIRIRRRRIVDDELIETKENVTYDFSK